MIDKKQLQELLEKDACKKNRGICETYNYCKFCKEPTKVFRISNTPCADAYLDMKQVTDLLKKREQNKEYIQVTQEKIKLWEEELASIWEDEMLLNSWYGELKQTNTFGMPKSTGEHGLELKILKRDIIRRKIQEFIKIEKNRLFSIENAYNTLEIAIRMLKEEENFIIECRYGELKLNLEDTITSFYKKYDKIMTIDQIKKKIASIKKKICENIKKVKKCRTF